MALIFGLCICEVSFHSQCIFWVSSRIWAKVRMKDQLVDRPTRLAATITVEDPQKSLQDSAYPKIILKLACLVELNSSHETGPGVTLKMKTSVAA